MAAMAPFQSSLAPAPQTQRRGPTRMRARSAAATDPRGQSALAADELRGSTEAYARGAQMNFQRDVGSLLGNLNALGGIRTGGVQAGVRDLASTYGEQIGLQAAQTAGEAARLGTERAHYASDLEFRRDLEGNRASESARDFGESGRRFDEDLGFRREVEARSGSEYDRDLEFRRTQSDEDRRRYDYEAAIAEAIRNGSFRNFTSLGSVGGGLNRRRFP
jgi:hypothetical protein